ncbi:MAG: hypothetical protein KGN76_00205 [Acidobacteriota bacterium]|nr:hypothetical protein [Acidobacteriota bacterium]
MGQRSCSIIGSLAREIIPDLPARPIGNRPWSSWRSAVGAPRLIALAAGLLGLGAAWFYHLQGLTLSHYDARGHLVVARRIIDSITPGWQQIGAVWLPLPHLLNMLPVQIDWLYRTGASAVAFSVLAFTLATWAMARLIVRVTGSPLAAWLGVAVFALNPNVLYLQSTPMEEPLLFGFALLGVALLYDWVDDPRPAPGRGAGAALAAACLTRYEAWLITAAVLTAAAWARWRGGDRLPVAIRRVAAVAVWPTAAILGFFVLSRATVGHWLVTSGFFVAQNKARGKPLVALAELVWGERQISGLWLLITASAGGLLLLGRGLVSRMRARDWLLVALAASTALPCYAFFKGHPFRIRYMVPFVAFEAVAIGVLVGAAGRRRRVAAVAALLVMVLEIHPFDPRAPMVLEAQWDRPNFAPRQHVTDCLRAGYHGGKIMISMGALGHYMQDLGRAGFPIRDFLHEGNGDIWLAALHDPRPFVNWILIEEKAEGGGPLARLSRQDPHFLDGFTPVCHGAGVVLYKRTLPPLPD